MEVGLMGLLLYDSPYSGNCYKVRLLFAHLGLPYERVEVDVKDRSNRRQVLGEANPALRVPTLILEDGRPLAESNAILWYFADGTDYVPTDRYERAQVLQWQFFEQYDHEPNIAVARFWLTHGVAYDPAQLQAKQAAGARALDAMERHLAKHPFLVGGRYSIADLSLYAYTHVAGEGGFDLSRTPGVEAWITRVASQKGHVRIED
ncbi:MAG TPA: glutathione S-transferase family protein [Candidatus Polarisedimenticolia bacterium]|nr:glutathione S-transferase family protein [Candidatus Polarisedimenticolia bacterium]